MVPGLEIIRLTSEAEARECAGLMSSTEPWLTLGRSREQAYAILTSPDREVHLASIKGETAGFVIIVMQGALVGYIQSIAVAPERRGRGVGTALMEFAQERIFSESPNVFICVSSFNPRARRLYQRLGFETVGELKEYIIPGHSEFLLRKTLGPFQGFRPGPQP